MELKLKGTTLLQKNRELLDNPNVRTIVNQGGTGSSKSWSLCQLFLILLLSEPKISITVARKALPTLKATAMKDFFNIFRETKVYRYQNHNKTDHIYRHSNGSEISFIGLDDPIKARSRRQNYLWLNEANEFSLEDYRQLSIRTDKKVFLDYNPSDWESWIYDDVLTRKDTEVIISTYLDNPFLPLEVRKEIEGYKELDENYWRIYGLGQRGIAQAIIYNNWDLVDELPEGEVIYGLDFGFNNPTALSEVRLKDSEPYIDERLYESRLTNKDLIARLEQLQIRKDCPIYADSAEPQRIEEIRQAGYWIEPADKDVEKGIDTMKSRRMHITKRSVNALKEIKHYSWKQKDGKLLDEPIKIGDHLMDSFRYAIHTHKNKGFVGFV